MAKSARLKLRVTDVLEQQNSQIDDLVSGFETEMRGMVASAQARTIGELQQRLSITGGMVDRTPGNFRILRQIDGLLRRSMKRAGYPILVEEYVTSFNGALPMFDTLLDAISDTLKTPLQVKFTKPDLALFESHQLGAIEGLGAVVDSAAAAAVKRSMFSMGALPFGDLVEQISKGFGRSVPEASGLAETAQVMFYRSVTDRGFRQIEEDLPPGTIRYRYEGPNDRLTRPFCKRTLARTKKQPMTRAQIDRLDNGTALSDVFISCGGYRCRHQWIVAEIQNARNS
jgi:hypothetical protein